MGSINSFEVETFCVWLEEDVDTGEVLSSMDLATAIERISATLDSPGHDVADDWHRLDGSDDGNRLLFSVDSKACDEYPARNRIEPQYRLRGHGGETALLCADFLFRAFPLRKILTEVYDFAEPLLRMLLAMGFEEAGYLPEHYWHEDRNWGLHQMVLYRDRWNECRERFADIITVQHRFDQLTPAGGDGRGTP